MGPPASPGVKRRAPCSGCDSAGASSATESSVPAARPGPRSSKGAAFKKKKKKKKTERGGPVEVRAGGGPTEPESVSDGDMSVGDADASESASLGPPLSRAVVASTASSAVAGGPDGAWEVQAPRRSKKRKAGAARPLSRVRPPRRAEKGAEQGSGAGAPTRPEAVLVVPATAFGGGRPPRRMRASELVARAEQLVGEVRSGMMDPTNKVSKGMASYIEDRVSGIMSLLVAATGRVANLAGECAGLRSAHELLVRRMGEPTVSVGPGLRPAAPPGPGRPATFAAAVGVAPPRAVTHEVPGPRPAPVVVAPHPRPGPRARRVPQHAVLVRASEGTLGPAEVKARLRTLVDPGEASICVTAVRTVHDGVLVETRTERELEFFRASEAIRGGGLTVTAPEAPRRKVGVFAVPAEVTEGVVMSALRSQVVSHMEEGDFRAAVRLVRKFSGRRAGPQGTHWVLEAVPEVAKELVARGRLFLGWHSCVMKDYVEADRCFRCLGLGHVARFCRRPCLTCGWCAGDGHTAVECPVKDRPPCCVNCRGAGLSDAHRAMDGACPLYRAALERQRAAAAEERANSAVAEERRRAAPAAELERAVVAEERARPGDPGGSATASGDG